MPDFDNINEIISIIVKEKTDEFAELVKISKLNPKDDFRYSDLRKVDFGKINLREFDFTGSDLRECSFLRAKIDETTIFEHARLEGAIFRNRRQREIASKWTGPNIAYNDETVRLPPGRIPFHARDASLSHLKGAVKVGHRTFIDTPFHMLPEAKFAFAVEMLGDSMMGAGIYDGDIAILKRSKKVDDGKIAAVSIDNQRMTLARFHRGNSIVRLEVAHSDQEPRVFEANRVKIQGYIVGLMRHYRSSETEPDFT